MVQLVRRAGGVRRLGFRLRSKSPGNILFLVFAFLLGTDSCIVACCIFEIISFCIVNVHVLIVVMSVHVRCWLIIDVYLGKIGVF